MQTLSLQTFKEMINWLKVHPLLHLCLCPCIGIPLVVMVMLLVRVCVLGWGGGDGVCVVVGGGYLSVRTLLSHSVMIKALPGTPYRTHSHNQPTGQELLSHAAHAPHSAHTISHTDVYMHTHIHACRIFYPLSSSFSSFSFTSYNWFLLSCSSFRS